MATFSLNCRGNIILIIWILHLQLFGFNIAGNISEASLKIEYEKVYQSMGLDSAIGLYGNRCTVEQHVLELTSSPYSILWFNDEICLVNFKLNDKTINVIMEKSLIALPPSAICDAQFTVNPETNSKLKQIWDLVKSRNVCQLPSFFSFDFSRNNLRNLKDVEIILKDNSCSLPLKILDLSRNSFVYIDDSFIHMQNLIILNLSVNNITDINLNAFSSLKNILWLDLSVNELTNLPTNVFNYNKKIKILNLFDNKLTSDVWDSLKLLSALRYLILDNNYIDIIPDTINKLYNLEYLSVNSNKLTSLGNNNGIFDSASILFLNLARNNISNINNIFAKTKIKSLDLNNNELRKLSFSQFPKSLEELTLLNNNISSLDTEDCIKHLTNRTMSLKFLSLSGISITNFVNACIPTSVEHLDLSHNLIERFFFHPDYQILFHYNKVHLKEVRLISNNFSAISYQDILWSSTNSIKYTFQNNSLKCSCHNVWLQDLFECKKNKQLQFVKNSIVDLKEIMCLSIGSINLSYTLQHLPINKSCSNSTARKKLCDILIVDVIQQCELTGCKCKFENEDLQVQCSNANLTKIPPAFGMPTVLQLDGNNFSAIGDDDLSTYSNLISINLSNSNINTISPNAFDHLGKLQNLSLANNNLNFLIPNSFDNLSRLTRLDLSDNSLTVLPDNIFIKLIQLEILKIENNQLKELQVKQFKEMKFLREIYLSGNSLRCNCSIVETMRDYQQKLILKGELFCYNDNGTRIHLLKDSHCDTDITIKPFWPYIFGTFIILVAKVTFVVFFWYEIQVFVYSRWRFRFGSKSDFNETKYMNYDGFLIYCDSDFQFMCDNLVPGLEQISRPYRLCINDRDFVGGEYLNDCIMEGVAQSSRTIVLLTQDFVRCGWCCFGFRTAHVQMLRDKCPRLIVIVVGEIPENVEPEMKFYLKTNTYLHWEDKFFWQKLYFAMAEHRVSRPTPELLSMVKFSRHRQALIEEDNLNINVL